MATWPQAVRILNFVLHIRFSVIFFDNENELNGTWICLFVYLASVNNAKPIYVTLERKRACEYFLLSLVLCVGFFYCFPFVPDCTLWRSFLTASRSLLVDGWPLLCNRVSGRPRSCNKVWCQRSWSASGSWKQHCLAADATEALVGPCGRSAPSRLSGPNGCGMCSRSHSSMYALGVIVVCTPIACMLAGMHVRQQVAALGIVFFAFVFCNTP